MAAAMMMEAVEVLRIPKVGPPDRLGQRLGRVRDRHQMDVVGHQAVGEDLLFPSKLLQLLLRADELHCGVVQTDKAALGLVVIEGE